MVFVFMRSDQNLMRILFGLAAATALFAGEAHASSIITLTAPGGTSGSSAIHRGAAPSIQVLGTPHPAASARPAETARTSPSITAMGEPAVTMEKVAAIGEEKRQQGPDAVPLVIRGGVEGDAFTRSAPPAAVPVSNAQQQPAGATQDTAARGKPEAGTKPAAAAPAPIAPAPAPAASTPPKLKPQ